MQTNLDIQSSDKAMESKESKKVIQVPNSQDKLLTNSEDSFFLC